MLKISSLFTGSQLKLTLIGYEIFNNSSLTKPENSPALRRWAELKQGRCPSLTYMARKHQPCEDLAHLLLEEVESSLKTITLIRCPVLLPIPPFRL